MHGHKKCGWEKSKHVEKIYKQKRCGHRWIKNVKNFEKLKHKNCLCS